ncbi:DNA-binding protein [Cyanothece sp. BG0011]|uniref:FitA-like ribbon-helix-helix domain-containing protein n=1 Tax=Cyanothece sp. BG0011 TaxID=2082950 RepID=UPI000D1F82AC|nr:DNA-binding protein [Cyanothece sp. BG0011]
MTNINLDNLSKDNRDHLQQRAAIHGHSLESELDSILTRVFAPETTENSLKELLLAMPDVGEDEDFNPIRDNSREISL